MKNAKKILILLITAVITFGAIIPVGAKSVSGEVFGRPGKIVTVEFEYKNISGIQGQFVFSDSSLFSDMNTTQNGLAFWSTNVQANGRVSGFAYFTTEKVSVFLNLTVSENAKPGDKCTITFNHKTCETENSDFVEGVDTVVVTIKEPLNTAKLEQLIAKAELLDKNDYTNDSWAKLEKALENAKKALNGDSQSNINNACTELENAINSLVSISNVDYSLLKLYINNAEKLVASEYTATSWRNLETALANARNALTSTSQQVVDVAAAELAAAIEGLVKITLPTVDYSALRKQIKIAEALNSADYTSVSWSSLKKALNSAYLALDSDDQDVVNEAAVNLKNAISNLVSVAGGSINYGELNRQIAIAETLIESDYTKESWAVLKTALTAAKNARNSKDQTVVDNAATSLKNAIASLVRAEMAVDYSELNKQINIALALKKEDYTSSSWANLLVYLKSAQSALNSNQQSEVDAAASALKTAIANLVPMNLQRLIDAIAKLKEYLDNDELANLWNRMHELLNKAEQLLLEGDQAAADACAIEIEELLVEIIEKLGNWKDVSTIVVPEPVPSEPDGDYCNITSHRVWPILFWVSLALNIILGGIIGAYLFLKRKKTTDDTPLVDYDISDDEIEE